jgi:nucleoside phosphorylase
MRTLIISAYPVEADSVLAKTTLDAKAPVVKGTAHSFYAGTISGKPVLVAMSGIGLINASNATEDALRLTCSKNGTFAGAVLFSGIAGGGDRTSIGDVAAPKRWTLDDGKTWREVDATMLAAAAPLAGPKAPVLSSQNTAGNPGCTGVDPRFIPLVDLGRLPKVVLGGDGYSADSFNGAAGQCIHDAGDTFGCQPCDAPDRLPAEGQATVTGALAWLMQSSGFPAAPASPSGKQYDAADQETAAAQVVAAAHGVPFLAFRAISTGPGDPLMLDATPVQSFTYRQLAADNAAEAVAAYMAIWSGPIAPPAAPKPSVGSTAPLIDSVQDLFGNFSTRQPSTPTFAPSVGSTTPPTVPFNTSASPKSRGGSDTPRSAFDWFLIVVAIALVADAAYASRRRNMAKGAVS